MVSQTRSGIEALEAGRYRGGLRGFRMVEGSGAAHWASAEFEYLQPLQG